MTTEFVQAELWPVPDIIDDDPKKILMESASVHELPEIAVDYVEQQDPSSTEVLISST